MPDKFTIFPHSITVIPEWVSKLDVSIQSKIPSKAQCEPEGKYESFYD